MNRLEIRRPDDWHLHLRDGDMLNGVLPHSAAHFARAIIMPNLVPPVLTTRDAVAYRERIMAALPKGITFNNEFILNRIACCAFNITNNCPFFTHERRRLTPPADF